MTAPLSTRRAAVAARAARRRRAYGQPSPYEQVPAAPLAALLEQAKRDTGLSDANLAPLLGMKSPYLGMLRRRTGPDAVVQRRTDERLRAALARIPRPDPERERPMPLPLSGRVSAERPRRQVRCLMALGWSSKWIALELGYRHGRVPWLYRGQTLTAAVAARVDALAVRVGDQRGPCERTRRVAREKGWHVPGAYNDATGELLPWAVPAPPGTVAARRQDREARIAHVAELTLAGMGLRQTAELLLREGYVPRTTALGAVCRLVSRDRALLRDTGQIAS